MAFVGTVCEHGMITICRYCSLFVRYNKKFFVCLADLGSCRSQPCQNGGTCRSTQNDYVCICAGGFKGRLCEDGMMLFFLGYV